MSPVKPPVAKRVPRQTIIHDTILNDDYFWLRDKKNADVLAYLEAENTYTDALMSPTISLQTQLYEEMVNRIEEEDVSVPVKKGDYFYYSRLEKGKNYSIHCRKKHHLDAPEEIVLDENILAENKNYFSLGALAISPNHQLLIYTVDIDGNEQYNIFIKNLVTNELLPDCIENTAGNIVWGNNNSTFYYTMLDETHRPFQVFRHDLGNNISDKLVFEEKDELFHLYISKGKNQHFIYIYLSSKITTEVHFMDATILNDVFQIVVPREKGIEYNVTNYKNIFYILTNENALNFKLMSVSLSDLSKNNWTEIIAHNENILLRSVEIFENHLVVYGRKEGFKNIRIANFTTNEIHEVVFPEPVYTFNSIENPIYESNTIRFLYSSLITPRTVYEYNMDSKSLTVLKIYEVKSGFKSSDYVIERRWATAQDGTKIPMSIAYKKGLNKDANNPCYLYAYGSYGSSTDAYFSTVRISLLERGFVFAIAHIRGGSEMGRKWYENGKFLHKKNTFTDFITCSEYLIAEKYTNQNLLVISGGSAGGLLMGAVVNMRPDLFNTVVAEVPFVDVINTMLDETIPLTVIEYEEWGNPNDKIFFDYMLSYSPYDNIIPQNYPNILVTAGLNDPRVQYWEPTKWVAKLRATKTDNNILLLKTNMGAGHGGASGRYEALKEYAFEYAFILNTLKIV